MLFARSPSFSAFSPPIFGLAAAEQKITLLHVVARSSVRPTEKRKAITIFGAGERLLRRHEKRRLRRRKLSFRPSVDPQTNRGASEPAAVFSFPLGSGRGRREGTMGEFSRAGVKRRACHNRKTKASAAAVR